MSLKLARDLPAKPFNSTLNRFDPKFWTIDFNSQMAATIVPIAADGFKVTAQFRSNGDLVGVRWTSEDHFNHEYFKYATDNDYSETVLAFRHNPLNPNTFTATITDTSFAWTYRMQPYALIDGVYKPLDPLYNPGKTYPASIMKDPSSWTPIPGGLVPYQGRTDYIFILDFADLKILHFYSGHQIDDRAILQISFDVLPNGHGLGNRANVVSITTTATFGVLELTIVDCALGSKLTIGDKIQNVYRTVDPSSPTGLPRQDEFEVLSFSGFGTGTFVVQGTGFEFGQFYVSDAFYGRFLKTVCPIKQVDVDFYFTDMTTTGNRPTILKRSYPQPEHSIMMTSGFDDSYSTTPARQIEQVHDLGYRGFWNTYIGMSHYFNGRTVYVDGVTGDRIPIEDDAANIIAFAGGENASGHFKYGTSPNRGIDEFRAKMGALYGISSPFFIGVDAGVLGSSVDIATSMDPTDPTGNYWWDLDNDRPGPALKFCIDKIGRSTPVALIWSSGDQDAAVLEFPTGRVPTPSAARVEACTRAIFAYMRGLWGADMPIFIQELGWAWTAYDADVVTGTPIFLTAGKRVSGNIVLKWFAFNQDPAGKTYGVDILDPGTGAIVRTLTVAGTSIAAGAIQVVYNTGMSTADFGFVPTFLRWQVRQIAPAENSKVWENFLPVDSSTSPVPAPTSLIAEFRSGTDVLFAWHGTSGANWRVRNYDVSSGALIAEIIVSSPDYTFTAAAQTAHYGFTVSFVHYEVVELGATDESDPASLSGAVAADSSLPPEPTALAAHFSGSDTVYTWSGTSGRSFRVRNYNVSSGALISETTVASPTYTFTNAAQVAVYGFGVSFVHFKVSEISGSNFSAEADYSGSVT